MFFGSLAFVFEVMIYVGLGLPLVNLLASVIGHLGDAAPELDADLSAEGGLDAGGELDTPDFDPDVGALAPDADGPDLDAGGAPGDGGIPLRFNLYCLCLALVVLGAVGIFALEAFAGTAQVVMLLVGVAAALAAYVLLYRLVIVPLKRNDSHALSQSELRFRHARVTFRITADCPGTIETRDAVGAVISYRAQLDPDVCKLDCIEEGEEVIVCDIDRAQNLCYVAPAQHKLLQ